MIKFALRLDKDKEEDWLNEMARKGYGFTGFFAGFYKFENCEPGKYEYQIDITDGFFKVSDDYREFMAEAGIEVVCCWGPWTILRRETKEGEFKLYTDVESSIANYRKILKMFKTVIVIELLCFYIEVMGAMRGSTFAAFCALFIGVMVIAFANIILKTKKVIGDLKARIGEEEVYPRKTANMVLLGGYLVNMLLLVAKEYIPHPLFLTAEILSCACMIAGIYMIASDMSRNRD